MGTVTPLRRASLSKALKRLEEEGPKAVGVIALWVGPDGHAVLHVSGFQEPGGTFAALGLLEWAKMDIGCDLLPVTFEDRD